MQTHTPSPNESSMEAGGRRRPWSRGVVQPAGRRGWPASILAVDGALLLTAGTAALAADLVGYFAGAGPFAALAGQPLTVGAVEAHGLAALLGLLILRSDPVDRWRWHTVALVLHLLLGTSNLLFWPIYAGMGTTAAGISSTSAHAALFGAQLACLALADAGQPETLPSWLRRARRSGLYVRSTAIATLLVGAAAQLVVIARGRDVLPQILTPPFELFLTIPMFYVSIAGWLAWRSFRFRGRWHRISLALVLIYFPLGLPFHLITITTGSTTHYAALPEWYSLLIVPVMAAIVACFASLRLPAERS